MHPLQRLFYRPKSCAIQGILFSLTSLNRIKSGIYEKKIKAINPDAKVYSAACPLLVPLVEEGWMQKPETVMIIKKYLQPLKVRQIDTLILGCTHYPLLKKSIQRKIGKKVSIIDSSIAVAAKIKDLHFNKNVPLHKIGITFPNLESYFSTIKSVFNEYEIPVNISCYTPVEVPSGASPNSSANTPSSLKSARDS